MSEGDLYGTVHNLVPERVFSSAIEHRLSLFISCQPVLKERGWWNRIARRVTWPKKSREEVEREMRE